MKKVGIYNPHMNTKGGGEKVLLALAEHISDDFEVILLSRSEVDKKELEDYFSVDLSDIKVKVLPRTGFFIKLLTHPKLKLPGRLRSLIGSYNDYRALRKINLDIFINNYVFSSLRSVAPVGLYICMFPQKLKLNRKDSEQFEEPTKNKQASPGFFDSIASGFRLTFGVLLLIFSTFSAGLIRVLPGTPQDYRHSFAFKMYDWTMDYLENTFRFNGQTGIDSYDAILANSEYTRSWVQKRWARDAKVLYPIRENMGPPAEKEKAILHVGRFFANHSDSHHKRQDVLLDTFKTMKDLHKDGWSLHLAGTTGKDPKALEFIVQLLEEADGYPVYFHLNTSFQRLKELYRKADIYWHATGYGFDASKYPEKQEHFGITTVEAMSAGAIPIVINTAGQKEIVEHEQNGYLWDSLKELKRYTRKVATVNHANHLRQNAVESSSKYDKEHFYQRIDDIFGGLK